MEKTLFKHFKFQIYAISFPKSIENFKAIHLTILKPTEIHHSVANESIHWQCPHDAKSSPLWLSMKGTGRATSNLSKNPSFLQLEIYAVLFSCSTPEQTLLFKYSYHQQILKCFGPNDFLPILLKDTNLLKSLTYSGIPEF